MNDLAHNYNYLLQLDMLLVVEGSKQKNRILINPLIDTTTLFF